MKLSMFNFYKNKKDTYLIFNTLSRAGIEVNKDIYERVQEQKN